LRKLSAQLERRRAKRQDIIEVQINVAVNDADGLGFLSRPASGSLLMYSMSVGDHLDRGFTIKLSDGDQSMILTAPAPNPHSHEQEQHLHEESKNGNEPSRPVQENRPPASAGR
jgi:hypothetical protein